jgi:hypothetical protein
VASAARTEFTVIADDVADVRFGALTGSGGAVLVYDPAITSLRQLRAQATGLRSRGMHVLGVALIKRQKLP